MQFEPCVGGEEKRGIQIEMRFIIGIKYRDEVIGYPSDLIPVVNPLHNRGFRNEVVIGERSGGSLGGEETRAISGDLSMGIVVFRVRGIVVFRVRGIVVFRVT
jgi:hypothetical protein